MLTVERWSTQTFTIAQMTPIWIFPAYPLLVIGPHAGILSGLLPGIRCLNVIVGGFVFQGIGFMVSLMIYAAFIYRLMTQKLPPESLRPGMFISIGPSGFTVSGLISMGQNLPRVITPDFMGDGALAGKVSRIMANWAGLWLWGLAWWFFIVSVGAHWSTVRSGRTKFAMTFYSYIFPNTALTTATFAVGKALDNGPIQWLGCVMACLIVVAWAAIFSMMIRAVVNKDILWPQKQEDREEGGWKTLPDEKKVCDVPNCEHPLQPTISDQMTNGTEAYDHCYAAAGSPAATSISPRALGLSDDTRGYVIDRVHLRSSTGYNTDPAIAERDIDSVVRGRGQTQVEDMV